MRKAHAVVIALVLAAAAVAGATAALRTVHLGAAVAVPRTSRVPERTIRAQRHKLAAWSASLRRAAKAKPPALPPVPRFAPVVIPQAPPVRQVAATPAPAPAPPSVQRVRPARAVPARPEQPQIVYVQQPQAAAQPTGEHEGHEDDHGDGGDD